MNSFDTEHLEVKANTGKGCWATVVLFLLVSAGYLTTRTDAPDLVVWPIVAAIAATLFLMSNSKQDWLLEHIGVITAVVTSTLLVVALFYWWTVNYRWTTEDALVAQYSTVLTYDNLGPEVDRTQPVTLTVRHAQAALINEPPYKLEILLTTPPEPASNRPIALSLIMPQGLLFYDPVSQERSKESTLSLNMGASTQAQGSLAYVNSGTAEGTRNEEAIVIKTTSYNTETVESPIIVEGQRGFAIRRFVTSELNPNSPVIFLVALLIPILATMMQSIADERRQELRSKRKQEYAELWGQFKEYFWAEDLGEEGGAQQQLTRMRDPLYRNLAVTEPKAAEEFLAFATLDFKTPQDAKRILVMHDRWPELWTVAYLRAIRTYKTRQEDLDVARKYTLMQILTEAQKQAIYLHPMLEGNQMLQDRLAALEHDSVLKGNTAGHPTWTQKPDPVSYSGLQRVLATEDASLSADALLLHDGAFWGGLNVFRDLLQSHRSRIIWGASGSGRTALAKRALFEDSEYKSAKIMAVYLPGRASWQQITAAIVRQHLLGFIGKHPTIVGRLSASERELLAFTMASSLGSMNVQAMITQKQLAISDRVATGYTPPRLLSKHSQRDMVKEQADNEELARRHLQLLKRAVSDLESRSLIQDRYDVGSNRDSVDVRSQDLECVHMLGFKQLLLVFDTTADDILWVRDFILPRADAWKEMGIRYFVFAPEASRAVAPSVLKKTDCLSIEWAEDDLEKMLDMRFRMVQRGINAKGYLEDPSDFTYMVTRVNYNPRTLIQLWRELVGKKDDITDYIGRTHINEALKRIGYG